MEHLSDEYKIRELIALLSLQVNAISTRTPATRSLAPPSGSSPQCSQNPSGNRTGKTRGSGYGPAPESAPAPAPEPASRLPGAKQRQLSSSAAAICHVLAGLLHQPDGRLAVRHDRFSPDILPGNFAFVLAGQDMHDPHLLELDRRQRAERNVDDPPIQAGGHLFEDAAGRFGGDIDHIFFP